MTTFGIIRTDLDGITEHFVGEDEVLWDWLHESQYEPAASVNLCRVKAPAGYTFHQGNLFEEGYDGGRTSECFPMGSIEDKKALTLLVSLRFVSSEEFAELEIDEGRIVEIVDC